ncbi:MAG: hypothetical protein RIC95_10515 [Vicingaceae bacterium]
MKIFDQDYEEASLIIQRAFQLEEGLSKDHYLLAICLSKVNPYQHQGEIESHLKQAAEKGSINRWLKYAPLDYQINDSLLASLQANSKNWSKSTQAIQDTVDYFIAKDQQFRKVLVDSIKPYYQEDSEELKAYWKKISRNDSLLQLEFLAYIKENGYPGTKQSGSSRVGIILLHLRPSLLESYQSVLMEEIKAGNLDPYYYASMMDRIACIKNKEAFYAAYPVEEECLPTPDYIIANRLKIGLSPFFQGPRRFVDFSRATLLKMP